LEADKYKGIIESLLFAAGDEGLSMKQLAEVMEIDEEQVVEFLQDLRQEYDQRDNRGLSLLQISDTYQLGTKKENSPFLKKLVESAASTSLSQASLETLAIVAYKQPVTRSEIEEIRGVKTERPLATLVAKGLVVDKGRAEGTGRAILYGTTKEFLDFFGLKTLKELPPLKETLEDQDSAEDSDLFFGNFETWAEEETNKKA
jgi:segregation and condensation protein B